MDIKSNLIVQNINLDWDGFNRLESNISREEGKLIAHSVINGCSIILNDRFHSVLRFPTIEITETSASINVLATYTAGSVIYILTITVTDYYAHISGGHTTI